jgi:predicted alpha/beta superfamily hydrolase
MLWRLPPGCLIALAIACTHAPPPAPAASPAQAGPSGPPEGAGTSEVTPVVIGESFRLRSRVLAEDRVINVYLPPGYSESHAQGHEQGKEQGLGHYPVLYMLDGGLHEDFPHITGLVDVSIKNQVIRPTIVVGIENTERRRDLVGPTTIEEEKEIAPRAGGSDRFRQFLREELLPEVAKRYRVSAETALVGESFAGLFVLESLLVEPALFDTYIAVDPSVWWNDRSLVRSAAARFASWSASPKTLFIATADAPEMQEGAAMLLAAYREHAPKGLTIHHVAMPEERHQTIFPIAALRAFRLLFAAPASATGG